MWKSLSFALGAVTIFQGVWYSSSPPPQPLPMEVVPVVTKTIVVNKVSTVTATLDHVPAWTTGPYFPRPSSPPSAPASSADSSPDSSFGSFSNSSDFSAPIPAVPGALPSRYQPFVSLRDRVPSRTFEAMTALFDTAGTVYDFLDQTTITGLELITYLAILWCLANVVYILSREDRYLIWYLATWKTCKAIFLLPTLVLVLAPMAWSVYPIVPVESLAWRWYHIQASPEAWAESFVACVLCWMCHMRRQVMSRVHEQVDETFELLADTLCQLLVVVLVTIYTILRRICAWLECHGTTFLTVTLPVFIYTCVSTARQLPGKLHNIIDGTPGMFLLAYYSSLMVLEHYHGQARALYTLTHDSLAALFAAYRSTGLHKLTSPATHFLRSTILLTLKSVCQLLWVALIPPFNHLYMTLLTHVPSLTTFDDSHFSLEAYSLSIAERKYLLAQRNTYLALAASSSQDDPPSAQTQLRALATRTLALRASLVEAIAQANYLRDVVAELTNYAYEHHHRRPHSPHSSHSDDVLPRAVFTASPLSLHLARTNPATGYFFSAPTSRDYEKASDRFRPRPPYSPYSPSTSSSYHNVRSGPPRPRSIDIFKHDPHIPPLAVAFPGFVVPEARDARSPWDRGSTSSPASSSSSTSSSELGSVEFLEDLAARGEVCKWDFAAGRKRVVWPEERGRLWPWD